jgi:hypothetical protein
MRKPKLEALVRALLPVVQAAHMRNATRVGDGPRLTTERAKPTTLAEFYRRRRG